MIIDNQGLRVLADDECRYLLQEGQLGRLGLVTNGVPAILPVNYKYCDNAIWFYTGPGLKLRAAERGETAAFEVDRDDPLQREGWSVLAVGPCTVVTELDELRRRRRLFIDPMAPGRRDSLVRLSVSTLSGRRIIHCSARAERSRWSA
jgi:hypothetical protein